MVKWTDLNGYENRYCINTRGDVLSHIGFIEYGFIMKQGMRGPYKNVCLSKGNKTKVIPIHRLVALTFIPNPDNKPCVNHINGIKIDNRVENLEWCTYSENLIHSRSTLGNKYKIFGKIIRTLRAK